MRDSVGYQYSFARFIIYLIILVLISQIDPSYQDRSNLPNNMKELINKYLIRYGVIKEQIYVYLYKNIEKEKLAKKLIKTKDVHRNFASVTSGSRIVKKTKGIESAKSVLKNDGKSMLFPCSLVYTEKIYFIIDLSEDFYMKSFLLISDAFYSNYIAKFSVQTSIDHISEGWVSHGVFYNDNKSMANEFVFPDYNLVRFIKIEVLSIHDETNNYYCSINQLKVYGKTITYNTKLWKEKLKKNEEDASDMLELTEDKEQQQKHNEGESQLCPVKTIFDILKEEEIDQHTIEDPYQEIYEFFSERINQLQENIVEIQSNIRKDNGFDVKVLSNYEKSFLFLQMVEKKRIKERFRKLEKQMIPLKEVSDGMDQFIDKMNRTQRQLSKTSNKTNKNSLKLDILAEKHENLLNEVDNLTSRLITIQQNLDTLQQLLTFLIIIIVFLVIFIIIQNKRNRVFFEPYNNNNYS